jgi:hypothetical protein
LFVDTRITMLAERARPGRTANVVSGFRMIQAALRTDCKSGGRVGRGDRGAATDSTTVAIRQALRVRSEMRARRVRRIGLVVTVWATPDDSRFVASTARRWPSRTLDKPGSTVTI